MTMFSWLNWFKYKSLDSQYQIRINCIEILLKYTLLIDTIRSIFLKEMDVKYDIIF